MRKKEVAPIGCVHYQQAIASPVGGSIGIGTTGIQGTNSFLSFYLKPQNAQHTHSRKGLDKQTPKYMCVCAVWGNPPTDSNPIPTNPQQPLSFPRKKEPLCKDQWELPIASFTRQGFPLFPEGNKEETDQRMIGMSKRKNEIVFTLIPRRHPKSSASLRLLIPTCGWKGILFATIVLISTRGVSRGVH